MHAPEPNSDRERYVKTILAVCGTRPEAIKLAPVVLELQQRPEVKTILCATAQHRQMLDSVLEVFGLKPDIDLNLMRPGQHLTDLLARMLSAVSSVLRDIHPDCVFVQGDTTTVLAASLAAFAERIAVGHVEAGLRTGNRYAPFPEEINRRLTGHLATVHFAPSAEARENLLREQVDPAAVFVTGNTVVDALRWVQGRLTPSDLPSYVDPARRLVLVTAHRRESFGEPLVDLCRAIRRIAEEFPDVQIVYPVHPNPHVRFMVNKELNGCPGVCLTEPANYRSFVSLMHRAKLILTDSGGIQEEAPSLGKPVLVLREVSERPEGIRAGLVRLVGTCKDEILREARILLSDAHIYRNMARKVNLYGDGLASARIADIILTGRTDLPAFVPET
jgi:UDP-N-acetylglucosamine 2-epimerase (non-hydrolysing)